MSNAINSVSNDVRGVIAAGAREYLVPVDELTYYIAASTISAFTFEFQPRLRFRQEKEK